MRCFSPLLILAALLAAACGGAVLPDEFTRERADGKIPVSIELIKKQTRKEMDGMPEGQAKAERWQFIEADYNACRLSSSRKTKAAAVLAFADCMSRKGYVYMHRLDAEQLHGDIAGKMVGERRAAKQAEEEVRLATEKKIEEERAAAEKKEEEKRIATEKQQKEKRIAEELGDAAKNGDVAEVKRLLAAGVNPDVKDGLSQTALMHAASSNRVEVAKILIAAGAKLDKTDILDSTALMMATDNDHPEVAKVLLDADNGTSSFLADFIGRTPLILAATRNHHKVAKVLLAGGVYPDWIDKKGRTALTYAAFNGHPKFAKMLLAAGALPNKADKRGWTALIYAAHRGHSEVAKILLAAGAKPNTAEQDGWTALMVTADKDYSEMAKILLAAGAKPNAKTNTGETALLRAAYQENAKAAKILLTCGANPNIKNKNGATAWAWAKVHIGILPIFEEYQRKFDAGWRPQSCEGRKVSQKWGFNKWGIAPLQKQAENIAERVFENAWRSIVVVGQGDSQGSGVIVYPNVVATNCHVVDSYGDIVIYKHDNRRATTDTTFNATIRHRDDDRDFCLLDVVGLQGKPAKVRRYNTLKIGEDVYAVGSPRGLDLSLSSGIISQLRQGTITRYIQTDAAISPGSSGGGLFDSNSNFIGILTRKIADEEVEGIGFAIPAELALNL